MEILDFIFQQMNVLVNSGNKYKNIRRALKNIENSLLQSVENLHFFFLHKSNKKWV